MISQIMYLVPAKDTSLFYSPLLAALGRAPFDLGVFGVGLFFMISGFVIPLSAEKTTTKEFFVRRIFRIYPTYAIGLAVSCLFLYIYAHINHQPFPVAFSKYLYNASLFGDWLNTTPIDYLNWTLEIEIKFYIIVALIKAIFKLRSYGIIAVCTSLMMVFNILFSAYSRYLYNSASLYQIAYVISYDSTFLLIIFVGICFFNRIKKNWSSKGFFIMLGSVYVEFIVSVNFGPCSVIKWTYIVSNTLAIFLFSVAYILKNKIKYNKTIDRVSNVSYPLYVVHAVSGYTTESIVYNMTHNPYISIISACGVAVSLALILHYSVELPTNNLGKKIFLPYRSSELTSKDSSL